MDRRFETPDTATYILWEYKEDSEHGWKIRNTTDTAAYLLLEHKE